MSALAVRELTPRGAGGVSVIELRGAGAREALENLCATTLAIGTLRLVRPRAEGEELDEALAWCESEERVELHLHGSRPLVRRVLAELGGLDAREEAPSLEQRLAAAPCERAARIVLDQLEGAHERAFARFASLATDELGAELAALAERSAQARYALEPARVVLAGPVNAGKSTLFNVLHGGERVIVSAREGTTRDAVVERIALGRYAFDLVDTAGERDGGADELEREGQHLGARLRAGADVVVWLSPADRPTPPPLERSGRWVVLQSRADLGTAHPLSALSAREAPAAARTLVEARLREALDLPDDPWTPGALVALDAHERAHIGRARAALARGEREQALALLCGLRTPAR
jgi:tRNA modification GTPase